MSVKQFNSVKKSKVPMNKFNLSHSRLFTADPFYLYPVMVEDCIPGDRWTISNEMLVRNNPMASPIMHEQDVYVHYFFVPYRLLWKDWEAFFEGGKDGRFVGSIPSVSDIITNASNSFFQAGGLFEYLYNQSVQSFSSELYQMPNFFPLKAYIMIWNEYYRDRNVMPHVNLNINLNETDEGRSGYDNLLITQGEWQNIGYCNDRMFFKRCWRKDYFTSSLPWQQRGTVPSFDLFGTAALTLGQTTVTSGGSGSDPGAIGYAYINRITPLPGLTLGIHDHGGSPAVAASNALANASSLRELLAGATIDLSGGQLNADVHDMRTAFQITRLLELSARGGGRYNELLKSIYPAHPRDDRLQRPEYIGGNKVPVVVNEVLQTAESATSGESGVGSMYGHGVTANREYIAKYRVQEHGVILGLFSVIPKAVYSQGIDRQWMKTSRWDYYYPQFMNLSEQAIYTHELFATGSKPVDNVFGYQSRYDEYRFRRNTVHGLFKTDFYYWHMARRFSTPPTLNTSFLIPSEGEINDPVNGLKRVLQVPSEPMYLVHFGCNNTAVRPLPFMAIPGYVDHH